MSALLSPENAALLFLTPDRSQRTIEPGRQPNRFLSTPSGKVALLCEGKGPVALMVHGWSGRHTDMAAFVDPLLAAGCQVVSMDLPAHGQSDGKIAAIVDLALAIRAVAEAVGPVSAIIAHSVGCAATAAAFKLGMQVARTVFVAPPARYAHFARAFSEHVGIDPDALSAALRSRNVDVDSIDLPLMVPSIDTRALIIHSTDDQVVPFVDGQAIAAAWPGARLLACEGLGHKRILSDSEVVCQAVSFLIE